MAMVSTCGYVAESWPTPPEPPISTKNTFGWFFFGIICGEGLLVMPALIEILLYIRPI